MQAYEWVRRCGRDTAQSVRVVVRDTGHGLLEISHNTLALVGLAAVTVLVLALGRADLRQQVETTALSWLQTRHDARELASGNLLNNLAEPDAVARATAMDPSTLSKEQAAVARWISRRYKVAQEPVAALVQEAWSISQHANMDPTLILAIMAVESSFNPFAQSPVGAQGLMQVMTRVHGDKYEAFGGSHAAFDPISNLRVGVQVLRECIKRAGSVREGLKFYVGAALLEHDGGYAGKVMMEQGLLRQVADGRSVPFNASNTPPPVQEAAIDEAATAVSVETGGILPLPAPHAASAPQTTARSEMQQVALLQ